VIHFDTTFLVDLIRERRRDERGPANAMLDELPGDEEGRLSVHALCELRVGVELTRDPARERARVDAVVGSLTVALPDDDVFPATYARLLADLQRRGTPVASMDLLIGTAAIVDSAPLVTRNLKHFRQIPGLDLRSY